LHREDAAKARIDEAVTILEETKDYSAARVSPDGETATVIAALADHAAAEGRTSTAVQLYEQLIARVLASSPDVEHDLRNAYSVSLLYERLARLHRQAHANAAAEAVDARRAALWRPW